MRLLIKKHYIRIAYFANKLHTDLHFGNSVIEARYESIVEKKRQIGHESSALGPSGPNVKM